MFDHIPQEMREFAQWVVWKYEETNGAKPTKVPYDPKTGRLVSVNDPSTWADFQTAINASNQYSGIGFVLTDNDPYTFIDLDNTEGDTVALQRQMFIFDRIQSYSELSPSGTGLHIITKGHVPHGRRRSKIEVYSSQRYMTMTGQVFRNLPIVDCQWFLDILWHEMGGPINSIDYGVDEPANQDDQTVIERALSAVNGEKFRALLEGKWEGIYPSQSEADFAFIDIIAFYTKNREQIKRIFRATPLGFRQKAQREDYVNSMVNRSFDRMIPPINIEELRRKHDEYSNKWKTDASAFEDAPVLRLYRGRETDGFADSIEAITGPLGDVNSPPESLLLDLAMFFYRAAPRPVPEVAIAGAIGFLAGICGRAWNVSGTGLNQYVLLLAKTGTGKAAMASGISKIITAVTPKVPSITKFIGPAEIASGQALLKHLANNSQCFVSIMGEFGILLKMLASPMLYQAQKSFKRALLDVYAKSGQREILDPTIYSDTAKNTQAVLAPAFSILGEAETEGFYEALDENLVSTGLLPRILRIEYNGPRPIFNEHHLYENVPDDIVQRVAQLAVYAHELMQKNYAINIQTDPETTELFKKFNQWCDVQINLSERNVLRQLWNRAHLKSMKLAALIAVGNNSTHPIIQADAAKWAIAVVVKDVRELIAKFQSGDVGIETSETKQLIKVKEHLRDYILSDYRKLKNYSVSLSPEIHRDKVFPRKYVSDRFRSDVTFKTDRIGANNAIERTLVQLEKDGTIRKLNPNENLPYKTRATLYQIIEPEGLG